MFKNEFESHAYAEPSCICEVHPKSYFFLSTTQAKALQYVRDIPLKASYIPSHISSFPQPKHRQLWPSPKCPESYCRVTISKVDFELANILAGSDSGDLS